jgi:hypothetical protein
MLNSVMILHLFVALAQNAALEQIVLVSNTAVAKRTLRCDVMEGSFSISAFTTESASEFSSLLDKT